MLKKRDKMGYGEDMNYQIVKSIEKMNSHSDKLFYEQLKFLIILKIYKILWKEQKNLKKSLKIGIFCK